MKGLIAVISVTVALAGCTLAATPTPIPATGQVNVTLIPFDEGLMPIGGRRYEARLSGGGASEAHEWDGGDTTIFAPAGNYTLEITTLFLSDVVVCEDDPSASGGQRCEPPPPGRGRPCRLEITIPPEGAVAVTYREQRNGNCELTAG